jgi:hypothetical protein
MPYCELSGYRYPLHHRVIGNCRFFFQSHRCCREQNHYVEYMHDELTTFAATVPFAVRRDVYNEIQ